MCVGAAHLSDGLVISPGTFTLITSTPFGCDQSGCPNFALFCVDLSHLSDGQVTGLGIRLRKQKNFEVVPGLRLPSPPYLMLVRESVWLGSDTRGLLGCISGRVERVLYDLSKLRGGSVSHTAKCTPHSRLKNTKGKSPHTTPQSAGSTLPTPGGAQRTRVPWRASHPKKTNT